MTLENPNFKQDKLSEDSQGEMSQMISENKNYLDRGNIIDQYSKKRLELDGFISELENYLAAKESLGELRSKFENLAQGQSHIDPNEFRETGNNLNRSEQIVAAYEENHHVSNEGGLEKIKDLLAELKKESDNLLKLEDQIFEQNKDYDKN